MVFHITAKETGCDMSGGLHLRNPTGCQASRRSILKPSPPGRAGHARFNFQSAKTMKKLLTMVVLGAAATAAQAQEVKGNGDAAKDKVAMCIGCHGIPGYRASFPETYEVPLLGGQSAKYIENALKAYQKGERKHPTMRSIAATLTEQDIANVAAYYSQQKAGTQNNSLK